MATAMGPELARRVMGGAPAEINMPITDMKGHPACTASGRSAWPHASPTTGCATICGFEPCQRRACQAERGLATLPPQALDWIGETHAEARRHRGRRHVHRPGRDRAGWHQRHQGAERAARSRRGRLQCSSRQRHRHRLDHGPGARLHRCDQRRARAQGLPAPPSSPPRAFATSWPCSGMAARASTISSTRSRSRSWHARRASRLPSAYLPTARSTHRWTLPT